MSQGIPGVAAFGAQLWAHAGELECAAAALDRIAGDGLPGLARDVEWLPTMALLVTTAAMVGRSGYWWRGSRRWNPTPGAASWTPVP